MHKNPNIVIRKVPPAIFLVDISKCYNNKSEMMVEIDEMGYIIWSLIQNDMTEEQVVLSFLELLTDEKTDDFVATVKEDIDCFLKILLVNNCLKE